MTSRPPLPPLRVFAQPADARVDVDAWSAHASRFFSTRIGHASGDHTFVVAPDGHPPGIRTVAARPCTSEDLADADAAEARAGGGGLALLARRCRVVWVVEQEAASDALALRLAAVLASLMLGPILDGASGEIFGVKTARAKLEALAALAALAQPRTS